jgi:hypothetical protein
VKQREIDGRGENWWVSTEGVGGDVRFQVVDRWPGERFLAVSVWFSMGDFLLFKADIREPPETILTGFLDFYSIVF